MDVLVMDFGNKVKCLRKNQNLSQEKLASILKINRNNLSRIETGKSEPSLSVIRDISEYFQIDVASLMDIQRDNKSKKEKIEKIARECQYLMDGDLDFLLRTISVLREEYVKKDE